MTDIATRSDVFIKYLLRWHLFFIQKIDFFIKYLLKRRLSFIQKIDFLIKYLLKQRLSFIQKIDFFIWSRLTYPTPGVEPGGRMRCFRVRIDGFIYGFQKRVSTDIFWIEHDCLELHATRYFHTTSYLDIYHTWIKERDHSNITSLLQLNHSLQN